MGRLEVFRILLKISRKRKKHILRNIVRLIKTINLAIYLSIYLSHYLFIYLSNVVLCLLSLAQEPRLSSIRDAPLNLVSSTSPPPSGPLVDGVPLDRSSVCRVMAEGRFDVRSRVRALGRMNTNRNQS